MLGTNRGNGSSAVEATYNVQLSLMIVHSKKAKIYHKIIKEVGNKKNVPSPQINGKNIDRPLVFT